MRDSEACSTAPCCSAQEASGRADDRLPTRDIQPSAELFARLCQSSLPRRSASLNGATHQKPQVPAPLSRAAVSEKGAEQAA